MALHGADRATRHDQLLRHPEAHDRGQAARSAHVRDQAELRLGQAEQRVVGHHAQVTGEGDLGAQSETGAVDLRDHRLRHLLQQVHELDAVAPERAQQRRSAEAAELRHVDAGAERLALAAHDHNVDVRCFVGLARGVAQLEHHVVVDGVPLLGTVQDDVADALEGFLKDVTRTDPVVYDPEVPPKVTSLNELRRGIE